MYGSRGAQSYKQEAILTASPEQLLLLMYDGAIRFLKLARMAMEQKDIQTAHNQLNRCQDILAELMSSLNYEAGGDIARNLFRLYDYYLVRLIEANGKQDVTLVDEVLEHLVLLKQTWETAIQQNQHHLAANQPASPSRSNGIA
jgi:flagellar secretion chaperone FliS